MKRSSVLFAALAALALSAPAAPLGENLTHYYDFEEVSDRNTEGAKTFSITGRTWNAESSALEVDTNITLVSRGKGIGTPATQKTGFGNAFSGGRTGACFVKEKAPRLKPEGDAWTISFWAMRDNGTAHQRLLVNGTPLDAYTAAALTNTVAGADTGFGFYVIDGNGKQGKVGIRLAENAGGAYLLKSIVSASTFAWGTDQAGWHHVMLIRDGTNLTLYVDGAAQGTAGMAEGSSVDVPEEGLCTSRTTDGQGTGNALDDLAVWGRALNAAERFNVAAGIVPVSAMIAREIRPLVSGLAGYYDFEKVSDQKTEGKKSFSITGLTWNAESSALEVNTGITLVSKGSGIGTPTTPKTGFGNAFSGGRTGACFVKEKAPFLKPSGNSWTISFWAMRDNGTAHQRLLVNGTPLNAYTAAALTAGTADADTGFGFYVIDGNGAQGKIGVRLAEKAGGAYSLKTIVSTSTFTWNTDQANWHHVLLIREGARLTLYVDGAAQGTAEMTADSSVDVPESGLCTSTGANGQGQQNALDDLAVWGRALKPAEIEEIAAGAAPVAAMPLKDPGIAYCAGEGEWPAVGFTDPADWEASMAFPRTARRDGPAEEPSYAFDSRFTRLVAGRRMTVVSVTNNGAEGINLWGVHKSRYAAGGRALNRDIFLDVSGGTFVLVSAGLSAWYEDCSNASVKGRQLTQLSGAARVNHVFGAGRQGGQSPMLTGDAGVVVRDGAVVLGSVVGGWTSSHSAEPWPGVSGNTSVLIRNVQGETSGGDSGSLPAGLIIGGSAWSANTASGTWIGGSASVTVDIPEGVVAGPTNFVKEIIGGSRSAPVGETGWGPFGGTQKVLGNASVTITAPTNVTFTAPIHAGSVNPGGAGAVRVHGAATLTINRGTFACALRGGVADGARTIVFNGPACFGEGALIDGFTAASSGGGAELRVLPGGGLSYDAAIGASLPAFTQLDGDVAVSASMTLAEIRNGTNKIHVATLADGIAEETMRNRFSGTVADSAAGIRAPAVFTLEGRKVMLSAGEPFVWNTTDGEWTAESFNNAPLAFPEGGTAVFSDSASGDGAITVTNIGAKRAGGVVFDNSQATVYALAGDTVTAGGFDKTGLGRVDVTAPLRLDGGSIRIAGDTSVILSDVGGTAGGITFTDRDPKTPNKGANASWGGLEVGLGTNGFTLNGPVSIGNGQGFTLSSALPDRAIGRKITIKDWAAFILKPLAGATLRFTAEVSGNSVGRIDKWGPGTARFDCPATFSGPLTVFEGKLVVNGAMKNCGPDKPQGGSHEWAVSVKSGATLRLEGANHEANRLPDGCWLLCDNGRVEMYGVNLVNSYNRPNFVLKNGATFLADCSFPGGHIKLNELSLSDSRLVIGGDQLAYESGGLLVNTVTAGGACEARYAGGAYENNLCPGTVNVLEGGRLVVSVKTMRFTKTGPGTLAAAAGSAFPMLTVAAGTLEIPAASGTFGALSLTNGLAGGTALDLSADGSVLRVDGAVTVAEGDAVAVNLAGRVFRRDELDADGRRYIIRWETPPAGDFVPAGVRGCRIEKLPGGAVLRHYGTAVIIR